MTVRASRSARRTRRVAAGRVVIAAGAGTGALRGAVRPAVPASAEPLHMNITEAAAPIIRHLVQHAERMITLKQLRSRAWW